MDELHEQKQKQNPAVSAPLIADANVDQATTVKTVEEAAAEMMATDLFAKTVILTPTAEDLEEA